MDDTGPAHGRASVTAARWALGGATVALVSLASGATALLVVTSTTGAALPLEDSHPLPGTTADGFGGSADVLLLPGGSTSASGLRAGRADTGPEGLLRALGSASSRPAATLTGRAARGASDGTSPSAPPAESADADVQVLPGAEDRPAPEDGSAAERPGKEQPGEERPTRPTPAPADTTPPAQEEPVDDEPGSGPDRTPAAAARPDAPAEGDDDKGEAKDKDKDKDKRDKDDEDAGSRPSGR